jgi:small subunit ribosomal protein S20
MANLKSSIKDIRRTQRRTKMNNLNRANVDKALRSTNSSILKGEISEAKGMLGQVYSSIDKMVKRKIISKNKAARQKSLITKKINSLMSAKS